MLGCELRYGKAIKLRITKNNLKSGNNSSSASETVKETVARTLESLTAGPLCAPRLLKAYWK
jgi:hypothetical protein